ncbi:MAG: HypC/HybG/HupF family hydrogenase formation chaperone [Planctomycetes bacterium]|nr:HypC/HybG/HupF family hydrogenase formation chaperone [Planctomycetota bacterium]MBM4085330.1 HypC/HybG/HupF family hydrogenase formation chaperone [Planctomycetota bacterium]
MCLAVPAKILKISGPLADVEIAGNRRQASIELIEDAAVGDYVLLHAGFAITKLTPEDAAETFALLREAEDRIGAEPKYGIPASQTRSADR